MTADQNMERARRRTFDELYVQLLAQACNSLIFVDENILRDKGMYEDIERIQTRACCSRFLTLSNTIDVEDTCEFLPSFVYICPDNGDEGGIRYMHRGVDYRASV